jgi:hypothetical protein
LAFGFKEIIMATVVLSIAGSIIGGPIGATIGAAIGQQIDQRVLFKPKGREGPRLGDLSVQTSTYGSRIPQIFGRSRVSGTVIWATDLVESRKKQSSGKNQPKVTTYSYTANFAVALSCRKVARIGRIWADGKLLRGEAGDFKTPTQFRFYSGAEDQPLDPLIASTEGISSAPAYRGFAYAVFEEMQLADYGNRIPSLSFEVIADEADVSIGEIAQGLTKGTVIQSAPTRIAGFVASGETARGNLEALSSLVPLTVATSGQAVELRETAPVEPGPDAKDMGTNTGEEPGDILTVERLSSQLLPSRLAFSYAEPERDYQPGLQRARRESSSLREEALALPVTVNAAAAAQLAKRALDGRWASREQIKISLPMHYAGLAPGTLTGVPGRTGLWQIKASELESMTVKLTLQRSMQKPALNTNADPGRGVSEADLVHGPTQLVFVDLPSFDTNIAAEPLIYAAAAGPSAGWRRAALLTSIDEGASWQEAGTTAAPAVMGRAITQFNAGTAYGVDHVNTVDIILFNPAMSLEQTNFEGLIAGRNLALLGQEIIQFEKAEWIAPGHYRLSGLLRGRRGTEWAMAGHQIDEPFLLIEADSLKQLPVPVGTTRIKINAFGVGDGDTGASADVFLAPVAQSLRPLSPVHLRMELSGQSLTFNWLRRSRAGWSWLDGVDAPLAEEQERYTVTVTPSQGVASTFTTEQSLLSLALTDFPQNATSLTISVVQEGIHGASLPLAKTFTIPI